MVSVPIPNPELWWPNGYGGQPLYQVEVSLIRSRTFPGRAAGPAQLSGWAAHDRIAPGTKTSGGARLSLSSMASPDCVKAQTGSRPIPSPPGLRMNIWKGSFARLPRPTRTCCACGVAVSMKKSAFTIFAIDMASWSGRSLSSPAAFIHWMTRHFGKCADGSG